MIDFRPFDGDGRVAVDPPARFKDEYPYSMRVTRAQARDHLKRLLKNRSVYHSYLAQTMWVNILWCETHLIPYQIMRHSVNGQLMGLQLSITPKE